MRMVQLPCNLHLKSPDYVENKVEGQRHVRQWRVPCSLLETALRIELLFSIKSVIIKVEMTRHER